MVLVKGKISGGSWEVRRTVREMKSRMHVALRNQVGTAATAAALAVKRVDQEVIEEEVKIWRRESRIEGV